MMRHRKPATWRRAAARSVTGTGIAHRASGDGLRVGRFADHQAAAQAYVAPAAPLAAFDAVQQKLGRAPALLGDRLFDGGERWRGVGRKRNIIEPRQRK